MRCCGFISVSLGGAHFSRNSRHILALESCLIPHYHISFYCHMYFFCQHQERPFAARFQLPHAKKATQLHPPHDKLRKLLLRKAATHLVRHRQLILEPSHSFYYLVAGFYESRPWHRRFLFLWQRTCARKKVHVQKWRKWNGGVVENVCSFPNWGATCPVAVAMSRITLAAFSLWYLYLSNAYQQAKTSKC